MTDYFWSSGSGDSGLNEFILRLCLGELTAIQCIQISRGRRSNITAQERDSKLASESCGRFWGEKLQHGLNRGSNDRLLKYCFGCCQGLNRPLKPGLVPFIPFQPSGSDHQWYPAVLNSGHLYQELRITWYHRPSRNYGNSNQFSCENSRWCLSRSCLCLHSNSDQWIVWQHSYCHIQQTKITERGDSWNRRHFNFFIE
jgi:hypothetical protein